MQQDQQLWIGLIQDPTLNVGSKAGAKFENI